MGGAPATSLDAGVDEEATKQDRRGEPGPKGGRRPLEPPLQHRIDSPLPKQGQDESCYLEPLQEAVEAGRTFAEELLRRFDHEWRGDIDLALRDLCREASV